MSRKYEKHIYRCCFTSEESKRVAAGYKGGSISENGELIVCAKGDTDMSLGDLSVPPKPESFGDFQNWPFGSYKEFFEAMTARTKTVDDFTFGVY
jgi:hypothetical protein